METQIIYILINESMTDIVKIGITNRPIEDRIRELYTTGVPVPFECFHASKVINARDVEKRIHTAFDKYRVNQNREFFEIEPESVLAILEMVELEDVTPNKLIVETKEDEIAVKKLESKKERFSFSMVDIPIGTILSFIYDENIKCIVIENNKVLLDGEDLSLSTAALKILKLRGYNWKSAQGAAHFVYEGETLKARRERFENK